MRKKLFSWGGIFLLLVVFFKNAFQTEFFADDFSFLIKTRIHHFSDFVAFFNPQRGTFYRPLGSEVFYFFIHLLGNNLLLAHLFVFLCFALAIYILYKNIFIVLKDRQLSFLTAFLYTIHFSHVYQLYWLAAFQEVAMFLFLNLSFYFFLNKKNFLAILFFIGGLLSKETALIFPFFILVYQYFYHGKKRKKTIDKKELFNLLLFFFLSLFFLFIYRSGLSATEKLVNYQPHFNLKLIINNTLWYSLWSLGFSSVFPDYFPHIFSLPIKKFWLFFKNPAFVGYLTFFFLYLLSFFIGLLKLAKKKIAKKIFLLSLILLSCFLVSIAPFTVIIHKWMIRLTLPLIFIILIQALVINELLKSKNTKKLALLMVLFFGLFNLFAIKFEEGASTYNLESRIVRQAKMIISKQKTDLVENKPIFIKDDKNVGISWISSTKLVTTFHNSGFFRFYFPKFKGKIFYNCNQKVFPSESLIIPAKEFFSQEKK